MNKNQKYLTKLLAAGIRGQKPQSQDSDIDWNIIFTEAVAHQVHTLVFPVFNSLNPEVRPPKQVLDKWQEVTFFSATKQFQYMHEASRVLKAFQDANIPVIALKGLSMRDYYPLPALRTMGDIDLLVKDADMEASDYIMKGLGYFEKNVGITVVSYSHKHFLSIEIHRTLLNLPNFKGYEEYVWKHANKSTICGQQAFTLSLEDNLIYLIGHMVKHFLNNGFGLRQLCDVILLVEKSGAEINWFHFWSKIKELGFELFTVTVFEMCRQYLGFNIHHAIKYNKAMIDQEIINNLIIDVISSGVFGQKTLGHQYGTNIVHNMNKSEANKMLLHKGYFVIIYNALFPGKDKIAEHYTYANKYHLLLPVAWFHRIHNVLKKIRPSKVPSMVKNVNSTAERRVDLIHKLKLL